MTSFLPTKSRQRNTNIKKFLIVFTAIVLFTTLLVVFLSKSHKVVNEVNQRNSPYPGIKSYTKYTMAVLQRKPLDGHQSIRPDFGPVINDITFYRYHPSTMACKKNNKKNSVVVLVKSATNNFEKRHIARQTWVPQLTLEPSERNSKTSINLAGFMFVLGLPVDSSIQKKIDEESETFGDILQIGMIDTYYNLTVKGVGLINWLNSHCSHVDFVFNFDDDVYVNVNNLAIAAQRAKATDNVLYGHVIDQPAERDGKHAISYEQWPWNKYPLFSRGPAVLYSGSAIRSLLAACQTVPHVPFDDVYFWGLCREKTGIPMIHARGIIDFGLERNGLTPCQVFRSVSFLTDSSEMHKAFHEATIKFYKQETQCILNHRRNDKIINPLTDYYPNLLN